MTVRYARTAKSGDAFLPLLKSTAVQTKSLSKLGPRHGNFQPDPLHGNQRTQRAFLHHFPRIDTRQNLLSPSIKSRSNAVPLSIFLRRPA